MEGEEAIPLQTQPGP